MDNIGLFNRSAPLPPGYRLEQSDATSWMAFYCQQMFKIALELSRHDKAWDDIATKFLEHFLSIAKAMNSFGSQEHLALARGRRLLLRRAGAPRRHRASTCGCARWSGCCRSSAATEVPSWITEDCPDVTARLRWLQRRRPEMVGPLLSRSGDGGRQDAAVAGRPGPTPAHPGADVRHGGVPVPVRDPVTVRRRQGGGHRRGRWPTPRSSTSRGSRGPGCSAETRTGAARSGSR